MKSKCFALLSLILLLLFITACEKQPTEKQEQYIISTPKEMHLNGSNIAYENAMFFADDTGKACFLDYETMQSSVACNHYEFFTQRCCISGLLLECNVIYT